MMRYALSGDDKKYSDYYFNNSENDNKKLRRHERHVEEIYDRSDCLAKKFCNHPAGWGEANNFQKSKPKVNQKQGNA